MTRPSWRPTWPGWGNIPWTPLNALLALVISSLTLLATLGTYWLSQRPYLGIVDQGIPELGNPADRFGWRFFIANTGTVPASATVLQHAFLVKGAERREIVLSEAAGLALILMPGQKMEVQGGAKAVPVTSILTDLAYSRMGLEVEHEISYRAIPDAWWRWGGPYQYKATHRFDPTGAPTTFVMKRGEAN